MSNTYAVPSLTEALADYVSEQMSVFPFVRGDWEILDTKILDEHDSNETVLKSIKGDVNYPATTRIGIYNKPVSEKLPKGASNVSIKTTYWVVVKDGDGNEIDAFQRSVVTASNGPLNRALGDETITIIGQHFSLVGDRDQEPASHIGSVTTSPLAERLQAGISNVPLDSMTAPVSST